MLISLEMGNFHCFLLTMSVHGILYGAAFSFCAYFFFSFLVFSFFPPSFEPQFQQFMPGRQLNTDLNGTCTPIDKGKKVRPTWSVISHGGNFLLLCSCYGIVVNFRSLRPYISTGGMEMSSYTALHFYRRNGNVFIHVYLLVKNS